MLKPENPKPLWSIIMGLFFYLVNTPFTMNNQIWSTENR